MNKGILQEKGFTKEQVKSRLLQHAAQLWELDEADIPSFDPLIELLFGAFAKEIEKIGQEVASSQTRVLHQLSQLLIPDAQTGPLPSHAILQASPVEPSYRAKPTDQFCLRSYAKANGKDIYFTPVQAHTIYDATIQYLAYSYTLYEVEGISKNTFISSSNGQRLEDFWIGLRLSEDIKSIPELSFYFDWPDTTKKDALIEYLPFTSWQVEGKALSTTVGLPVNTKLKGFEALKAQVEHQIICDYAPQFLTVNVGTATSLKRGKYPSAFKAVFSEEELTKVQDELIWLQVSFPSVFSEEVLDNMTCGFNCFPVMNRQMHEFSHRLQPLFNIVPLETEDLFYEVHQVSDTNGDIYTSLAVPDYRKQPNKTYFLRQEGVARFDQRNATEMLGYLMDLLRDESAAFSALGRDYLGKELKELDQIINRFTQYLSQYASEERGDKPYLFIRSADSGETVFVNFWSTLGSLANRIPAGEIVEAYNSADYGRNVIRLFTATRSGRNPLSENDRLKTFRSSLLSHGRLVTEEDIKAFCFAELGNSIDDVTIRKGVAIDDQLNGSVIRVIEVVLKTNKSKNILDWHLQCQRLTESLKTLMNINPNIITLIN